MPTYEFKCPKGHTFDRFYRKISDAPAEVTCPECGARAERQLSGGAGLLFKGSGFYLTDYGKNAHRPAGSGRVPSEAGRGEEGGGAAEGTKTEGKESKSETPKIDTSKSKPDAVKSKSESPKPKKE
jgi:putative FmdB family regulatory protein